MQNILKNIALNGTKRGKKMSREIKFRIWDKINRMWLRCFNVNLFDIGDLPNVELMQYTGVKDKNGKEIYEGDIIICKYGPQIAMEVKWVDEGFRTLGKYDGDNYVGFVKNNAEVIGNVYENKNLLEENK